MAQLDQSYLTNYQHFYDGGRYHIETSPLIYRANQWTGFYMITVSVMKELTVLNKLSIHLDLRAFTKMML